MVKLLLNAEPFGFGPAAAIAGFFPHLRPEFECIGYIGQGHTLDLQDGLPYNAVHDVTRAIEAEIDAILDEYDVLLTATDFGMAERARARGLKVCIYDPLAWYWPGVFEAVREADLYVVQDFVGVGERLAGIHNELKGQVVRVAPVVPEDIPMRGRGKHVLINMGGLQNPFWSVADAASYAGLMLAAITPHMPAGVPMVVATSAGVAELLPAGMARHYGREEMLEILAESTFAIMTPGLGNIYDAAHFGIPTIWLPPTNDSQGQQRVLLEAFEALDGQVTWGEVLGCGEVEYRGVQAEVLEAIANALRTLETHAVAQGKLGELFGTQIAAVAGLEVAACGKLIEAFGRGGTAQVAAAIVAYAKELDGGSGNG